MSTHYRLIPPFLHVAEEQDFSDAWESFCCKILNIENNTTEIYVRNPPEQGVDIFYPSEKIAYQCKSVESGKSGDFNVTQAVSSIQSALKIKTQLPWNKYVLCTNVLVTGTAEKTLKEALPEIEIKSNSFWVGACQKHPLEVEANFRRLVEVPRKRVEDAINNRFIESYSDDLINKLDVDPFDILLYSNRDDGVFRVPVSEAFTIKDLLEIFRGFFKLPESKKIETQGIEISLSHSVVFENRKMPLSKSLKEVGIVSGSIVTYWTKMVWRDSRENIESFDRGVMHMRVGVDFSSFSSNTAEKTLHERKQLAIEEFSWDLRECFRIFEGTC